MVQLRQEQELFQKIFNYPAQCRYKDAEDVIQRALHTLRAAHQASHDTVHECQEAAARIRELRQGVTLGGLTIRQLIHEGHPY